MKSQRAGRTARAEGQHGTGLRWAAAAALALAVAGAGCGGNVEIEGTGGAGGTTSTEDTTEPVGEPTCGAPFGRAFGAAGTLFGQGHGLTLAGLDACGTVLAGGVNGPVDAGGGLLPGASDTSDVLIVALDAGGKHLWSRRFGDGATQFATSVAVGPGGDVIVAGHAEGTIDFGGGALPGAGEGDLFIARFDAGGQHLWSKRFESTVPWGLSGGVTLSPDGDLVVTGAFAGELDLGGGVMDSDGENALFAAKLDAGGGHVWSRRFLASDSPGPVATAVDPEGNVHLTGMFTGTLDLGGGVLTSVQSDPDFPGDDMYLAKLTPDGETVYGRMFGGAGFTGYLNRIAATDDGHAVVSGMYWGAVDFGKGMLQAGKETEPLSGLFLVSFDAEGKAVWSGTFGDGGISMPLAMAASGTEVAFTGLAYMTSIDLGGGALSTPDGYAGFVARFDGAGQHRGSAMFETTPGGVVQTSGLVAGVDHLVIGGTFNGTMAPGTGPLTSAGFGDAFVARVDY